MPKYEICRMNLLVVAATKFEIAPLLATNITPDFLITGVGIPSTIFTLSARLSHTKYDMILQAGIGGSFNNVFEKSNVFFIKEDTFADIGVDENGKFQTLFEMGFENENEFPYTNGWLKNEGSLIKESFLPVAKAITVNKITNDLNQVKLVKDKFNADIESMEGAAFHYVCLLHKVNFLQIRSISNVVGERDKSKWKLKEAIEVLNDELKKIIQKLN